MKKSVKRILMSVIVAIGLVASVGLGFFMSVQAATAGYITMGEESALLNCYMKVDAFKSPVYTNSFTNQLSSHGMDKFMNTSTEVFIPVGLNGNDITENCSKTVQGLLGKNNMTIPNQTTKLGEIEKFLGDIGYTNESKTSSNGKCVSFMYNIKETTMSDPTPGVGSIITISSDSKTPTFCAEKITNGKIDVDKLEVNYDGVSEDVQNIIIIGDASGGRLRFYKGRLFSAENLLGYIDYKGMTWENFKKELEEFLRNNRNDGYINPLKSYKLIDGSMDESSYDGTTGEYIIDKSKTTIIGGGVNKLLGRGNGTYPIFSEDDKFSLYTAYMIKVFSPTGDFMKCGVSDKEAEELTKKGNSVDLNTGEVTNKNYKKIKRCNGDKVEVCYAKVAPAKEDIKVGRVADNMTFDNGECDWDCVAEGLADYEGDTCPEDAKSSGSTLGGSDKKDDSIVDCNQLKTIGAMQWVLCPTMNNMQYTTSWIDNMTQDWLQVDTKLYSGPQVTEVWGYIRNVANVLMIVFLLVVIFSQLTGRGIDNYGIKKMLPRLIMMALIINLSMYICQLAVDLSNIAGSGLRDMFGAFGAAASGTEKPGDPSFLTGMIMGMFAAADFGGAVGFGTLATLTALAAPTAVAIVIAVIVLLLAILVAVVVLFLMLGAREIIVIVCVVISPLAFAAYVLPNTQNLFKKWWELFKAALIIFPICGAMGGISSMLRKMAETGPDLHIWGFAILMILPYLGFFLIPMLLKNAIAALGKIGGALTAMGNKVKSGGQIIGKGAMNAAKNTEKYKQLSAEAAKKKQAKMSQKTIDKLEALKKEKEARGEKLSDRDAQRLYDAQQTQTKLRYEQEMANIGAVVPSSEQIYARATSAKDTQEMKLIMDSYAGFGRTRMANELTDAYTSYLNNRSESNGLRLRAALSKADSMGMDKELLNVLNGTDAATGQTALLNSGGAPLSQLGFRSEVDGKETEDAKIATTLAGLNNKVVNRFGKQLGKAPEDELSLNQFATNMGAGGLREAISGKGPDYLNGVDEDTVGFLAKASEQAGGNVVDTETLLHAAASTTDTKVNNNLAGMLANADSSKPSGLTGKILVAQRGNALSAITNQVKNAGYGSEIHKEFMKATTDIANNPELLSTLTKEQAKMFNEVRGDKLFKVD